MFWNLSLIHIYIDGELDLYPEIQRSVINYGVPVLSGRVFSGVNWRDLERQIHNAIVAFEPRILPGTLSVKASVPADLTGHHNLLQFELRGELWSMPYPVELLLRSELDLETGYMKLTDQLAVGGA